MDPQNSWPALQVHLGQDCRAVAVALAGELGVAVDFGKLQKERIVQHILICLMTAYDCGM